MYTRIGILQTAVFLEIYSLDESESTASNSRVSLMSLFYLGILESCSKLITQLNEKNCQRKTFLVLLQDFVTKLLTHDNILWVSLSLAFFVHNEEEPKLHHAKAIFFTELFTLSVTEWHPSETKTSDSSFVLDPVDIVGDVCVHAWQLGPAASNAPTYNSDKHAFSILKGKKINSVWCYKLHK